MLTLSKRCCTSYFIAYLLSMMRLYPYSLIYLCVYALLIKLTHTQPGFHRSHVVQNILYIDAHVIKAMLYIVFYRLVLEDDPNPQWYSWNSSFRSIDIIHRHFENTSIFYRVTRAKRKGAWRLTTRLFWRT